MIRKFIKFVMTEITVIKPELGEDRILSKEERAVLFQELSSQLNISYDYLEELGNLEDETLSKEARAVKPDILILLIRKILDFGNVIPIVKEIKNNMKTIEEVHKEFNIPTHTFGKATGGAAASKSKQKPKQKASAPWAISGEFLKNLQFLSTQLIKPQKVIPLKNLENYLKMSPDKQRENYSYIVAQDESIEICGLVINQEVPIVSYYINQIYGNMSISGRWRSGNYSEPYLWNAVFTPYNISTGNKIYENLSSLKIGKESTNMLNMSPSKLLYALFSDGEKQIKQLGESLLDYLIYSINYRENDYVDQIVELTSSELEPGNKKPSYLFKNLTEIMSIFREPTIVNVKEEELTELKNVAIRKFFEELEKEKLLMGSFSFKYNDAIWFDLMADKMIIVLEKLLFIYKDKSISKEQKNQYENDIKDILDKKRMDLISRAQIASQDKKYQKTVLREMKLRWYYIRKFGFERFHDITERMPKYGTVRSTIAGTHGTILDYVNKKEKEILELEYKNQEKLNESLTKYKAPWVPLVRKMRTANSKKDRIRFFNELKKYLPVSKRATGTPNDWIRTPEGYPIICPHVKEQIELEEKNLKDNDIRDAILKYAGDTPLYQAFYCKICGELITYSEEMEGLTLFEGDQPAVLHTLDEVLRDFIWKQTNQVVRTFVQFKELRSSKFINMFISNITSKLYDFINLIEKKLLKSKTSTLEEVENKRKLFTVIYIYAMLIKIISDNYQSVSFVKLGKEGYSKMPVQKLLQYAIEKIILTQNVIINKLNDINEEFLESSLSKAYKNISLVMEKSKLEPPPEIDLASTMALDPIYLFTVNMTALSRFIKETIKPKEIAKIKKIHEDSFKLNNLFNLSSHATSKGKDIIASIYNDDYVYQHLKSPTFSKKSSESFDELSTMSVDKLKFKTGGQRTRQELLGEFYEGYLIESFEKFLEYIHSKNYLKPIYHVKIIRDPENENIYHISSKLDDDLISFDKGMQKLRNGERILSDLKKYYDMPAYSKLPFKNSVQFTEINIKESSSKLLSRTYGETFNKKFNVKSLPESLHAISLKIDQKDKFHKHKWDIYVYVPLEKFKGYNSAEYKESDLIYYTKKELSDSPNMPQFYDYKLIDRVCKTCLFSLQNIQVDIPNPQVLINKEQLMINFYNYYENRCPNASAKNDFHDFDKNGVCKNCGFIRIMYFNKDTNYFNKYSKKFQKELSEQTENSEEDISVEFSSLSIDFDSVNMSKKLLFSIPESISKWKYNSNIINELVSKTYDLMKNGSQLRDSRIGSLKVKKPEYYNMFVNLGLAERFDYENIVNGTESPYKKISEGSKDPASDVLANIRINKLDLYIKEIIFDYTILINNKNLSNLPLEIKIIVDGSDPKEVSNISKLPSNMNNKINYFDTFKFVRQLYSSSPVKVSEFLMEYICQILLNLLQLMEKTIGKKTSQEFIIYLINKLFAMEKASSKLKEAKSAAIEATQKPDIIDEANMQDHSNSRMYDDLTKGNKKGNYDYDFDMDPIPLDAGNYNSAI